MNNEVQITLKREWLDEGIEIHLAGKRAGDSVNLAVDVWQYTENRTIQANDIVEIPNFFKDRTVNLVIKCTADTVLAESEEPPVTPATAKHLAVKQQYESYLSDAKLRDRQLEEKVMEKIAEPVTKMIQALKEAQE